MNTLMGDLLFVQTV